MIDDICFVCDEDLERHSDPQLGSEVEGAHYRLIASCPQCKLQFRKIIPGDQKRIQEFIWQTYGINMEWVSKLATMFDPTIYVAYPEPHAIDKYLLGGSGDGQMEERFKLWYRQQLHLQQQNYRDGLNQYFGR